MTTAMLDLRRANGWTIERVARSTGIHPELLDDLECGRVVDVPDECVDLLERYYGVSWSRLTIRT